MHNHSHPNISRSSLWLWQWTVAEFRLNLRRLCPRKLSGLFSQVRAALLYTLLTIAISGLFLGGAYMFLFQLAEHGW